MLFCSSRPQVRHGIVAALFTTLLFFFFRTPLPGYIHPSFKPHFPLLFSSANRTLPDSHPTPGEGHNRLEKPHIPTPGTTSMIVGLPTQKIRYQGQDIIFSKPTDFKIIALVFYGRREYVQILSCYLQRNLVRNGGFVDEVIFVVRTDDEADLRFLEELLETNENYSKYTPAEGRGVRFADAWKIVNRGKMYIKIDDDVVFFEPSTIPTIVHRKLSDPSALLVSANVINQPALSFVHYHLGTMHPYLPSLTPPESPDLNYTPPSSWRPSRLPAWTATDSNFTWDPSYITKNTSILNSSFPAPYPHHPWHPAPSISILSTPIAGTEYNKGGPGFYSWVIAAQTHYSLLQNIESRELWRYRFDTWDYGHTRLSINFICIWGDDVVDHLPFDIQDDERFLTMVLSERLGRDIILDGSALAAHFGFSAQVLRHGKSHYDMIPGRALRDTDLLVRYRALALDDSEDVGNMTGYEGGVCTDPNAGSGAGFRDRMLDESPGGWGRSWWDGEPRYRHLNGAE